MKYCCKRFKEWAKYSKSEEANKIVEDVFSGKEKGMLFSFDYCPFCGTKLSKGK